MLCTCIVPWGSDIFKQLFWRGLERLSLLGRIPDSFAETILCSMGEPALIFDETMSLVWANPSAEMYFGHSSEYMHGRKCLQLFGEHVECMDRCPVEKAFATGEEQVLAVDDLASPKMLVEAVPCRGKDDLFVLAIIHSPPENSRSTALSRELSAKLNRCANLEEAAPVLLEALGSLAFVSSMGLYRLTGDTYELLAGKGVPRSFPAALFAELPVGTATTLAARYTGTPEGASVYPSEKDLVLYAGRDSWGPASCSMLEMVGEALKEFTGRLSRSS